MTEKAERAARLRQARMDAGFKSAADAARSLGVAYATYAGHENGERGLRFDVARDYAKAFKTDVQWIFSGKEMPRRQDVTSVVTVPVYGDAAGGIWIENDDVDEDHSVPVSPDPRFPLDSQYARRVKGNSVARQIASGEYAIIVRLEAYGQERIGDLVDVERTRAGLREHTIKVFDGDGLRTDPANGGVPERISMTNGEDDTMITICGIVIGVYRPILQ